MMMSYDSILHAAEGSRERLDFEQHFLSNSIAALGSKTLDPQITQPCKGVCLMGLLFRDMKEGMRILGRKSFIYYIILYPI